MYGDIYFLSALIPFQSHVQLSSFGYSPCFLNPLEKGKTCPPVFEASIPWLEHPGSWKRTEIWTGWKSLKDSVESKSGPNVLSVHELFMYLVKIPHFPVRSPKNGWSFLVQICYHLLESVCSEDCGLDASAFPVSQRVIPSMAGGCKFFPTHNPSVGQSSGTFAGTLICVTKLLNDCLLPKLLEPIAKENKCWRNEYQRSCVKTVAQKQCFSHIYIHILLLLLGWGVKK